MSTEQNNDHKHTDYPTDESDGFYVYDFERADGSDVVDEACGTKYCKTCYRNSAKYREFVANDGWNNDIDDLTINEIRLLIKHNKLYNMDKESMVDFKTSCVMKYKDGLLIANER